jgi:hypothetical protein
MVVPPLNIYKLSVILSLEMSFYKCFFVFWSENKLEHGFDKARPPAGVSQWYVATGPEWSARQVSSYTTEAIDPALNTNLEYQTSHFLSSIPRSGCPLQICGKINSQSVSEASPFIPGTHIQHDQWRIRVKMTFKLRVS